MSKKITRLSDEQSARMAEWRDRWIEIGLSTSPADRPAAEAAIAAMYRRAGLSPPKIVWCGSPLSQGLTRAVILNGASVRASVVDSVWASVGASVGDSVWASVYGQHDAGWLSFYDFFQDIVGLREEVTPLADLIELAKSAGWALPHKNICWVSERHNLLSRDERGRLHNLAGPAVMYPDGWKIYAVHGVRVPEWIIERPAEINVAAIESEQNAEVRRVMMELFGLGRYVSESGAEVVDVAPSDHQQIGIRGARLLRKPSDLYDRPLYFVECVNSSPEPDGSFRKYHLAINPDHYGGAAGRDVVAALASTWRDPADRSRLIFPTPADYCFVGGES